MIKLKNIILLLFFILFFQQKRTRASLLSPPKKVTDQIQSPDLNLIKAKKLYNNEEYSKSLAESLKILDEAKKNQLKELIYSSQILIGKILKKSNQHTKALRYFKDALATLTANHNNNEFSLQKTNPDSVLLAENHLLIGTEYSILNESDSAKYFYLKVINTSDINNHITKIKGSALNNLSALYTRDSAYTQAKKYAEKAITLHQKTKNKVFEASALSNLASIYLLELNYSKARELYLRGIELIKNDNSDLATRYKEDLYYNLAWTLYLLKDYKAYEFQEKSFSIKDNLREREIKRIVKGVFEKHQVNLVNAQKELIEAQKSKTNLLFAALSLLVIVISCIVVYNYRLRQNNLKLKLSETNLKQQQNIEQLKSETHTKIINATLDGKESERKEIAETLHDNVSALLSSANMHLSATKKKFDNNIPSEIEKTQAIILEASQKVRDLSHNLISSILLKFGLEFALKDVARKYSNSELKINVLAQNVSRYNQSFEIKIYNIIQELMNNILKHSKANNAQIMLKQENNLLTIIVNDNGIGFLDTRTNNNGIGLSQIQARIKVMNGNFTLDSQKNKGTKISIKIPIEKQQLKNLSSVS